MRESNMKTLIPNPNGDCDLRVMDCTLNPEVLPPATVTEGTEKSVRKKSDTSLAVFDTGANGWRSFVVRNIQVLKYN
jgi:hypothetical protein